MRAQTFIVLVACALAAMVLAVSCSNVQDQKCREIAKGLGIDQGVIDSVPKFVLYGPPQSSKEDCSGKCISLGKTIGFDFFGKQGCCCGSSV